MGLQGVMMHINEINVDHEVRLRVLERLSERMDTKLNALIVLAVGSFLAPVIFKLIWG